MWVKESLRKTCLLPGEVGHSCTQQNSKKLQQRTTKYIPETRETGRNRKTARRYQQGLTNSTLKNSN
jgi:hypothetical protein